MPIVLRLIKGSELTFAELDGNFTDLDNRLDDIEAANLISRVTRLEQAGTPIYFDSDDVMVMLDSIWGGTVDSFLATTDSVGLARFDADYFSVDSGLVTLSGGFNDPINLTVTAAGGVFAIDGDNQKTLTLYEGNTYRFDQSDASNAGHPLRISANNNGTHGGGVEYTTGVIIKGTPGQTDSAAYTQLTIQGGAPKLYYYCKIHSSMGGVINTHSGQVAGTTTTDSAGIASFTSADFNVTSLGRVSLTDSAVHTRISAVDAGGDGSFVYDQTTGTITYTGPSPDSVRSHFSAGEGIDISATGVISGENASTTNKGIASFNSSHFSVSSGVVSLAGGSGIPVSSSLTAIGSFMFVQSFGMPFGTKYEPGNTIPGSRLRYGRFQNGIVGPNSPSLYRPSTSTPSSLEAFYYNGSDNCSSTLPGSWRLLGPGTMSYYNGNGSNMFGLVQRIS